ncbi:MULTISPECIES: alpha/beta fold hydrolase [unclassified Pseudomonas]|uniref:alpha/beta fold hydrolase n=1 Tax=unclassified Pseudomonas TaxID=196821 RepID=UPI000BA4B275|nr:MULTISPECIES: alpha/beta hydrolase [unclassified Pseudomonas]MCU1722656.1 alpha/beta hydrolase [Pseudomonas sp. 5P_5.1_Bac1]MCU1733735.1 alpha/beta hydrolase [Pseudomonas sp. 20P_3.2_Bac4]MCU1742535.1 alpha/beta hydrolase [Pseudomonas sp. 20P_3.2_Bac5]
MHRRTVLQTLGTLTAGAALAPLLARAGQPDNRKARHMPDIKRNQSIVINGATLNYSIAGETNEQPLIVLHGGRGQGQHDGVFAAHAAFGDRYKVIGFDMRGHGHSSVTPPFTFDQIVEDIEQLRVTLGGGRKLILQGGSFGGFIAQAYAVRYPQHLSHLILRGTAPSYRHEVEATANLKARAAKKAPMATEAMLQKIFTPTLVDDEEFRLIMFALAPMYVPDGVAPDLDGLLERSRTGIYRAKVHNDLYEPEVWHAFDVVEQLARVKCPALVICGAEDWICDPVQSKIIAEHLPGARLVVVPGADHAIPADVLYRETDRFLHG